MKKITLYFLPLLATLFLVGCFENPPQPIPPDPKPPVKAEKTVIIYMVADNNLSYYAIANINAMEKAFSDEYGTRLLLFYNDIQGNCRLYNIKHDEDETRINSEIIQVYKYKTDPCMPTTLSSVIADCRSYSQTDSYSLIFWSHGTGWIPKGMAPPKILAVENPSDVEFSSDMEGVNGPQYTFGSVYSFPTQMEIYQLAAALPQDLMFDYICFDACLMAGVEVAYELRHRTHYFMASAAEILAEGYPYKSGLKYVLQGNVKEMGRSFFDYYNSKSGVLRSATTVVVDCSKLDNVAKEMRKLVALGGELKAQQQFGRNLGSSANYSNLFWDLGQMATLTWGDQANDFLAALNDATPYKAATEMLFENDPYGDIEVNTFSGMTVYLPKLKQSKTLEIYRKNYAWAIDTELYQLAQ